MAMRDDFPSNSLTKKQQEKKKIEKVVKGQVTTRKKSVSEKFSDDFLASDVKTVGTNLVFDVLIPAAKEVIANMIGGLTNGLLYGNTNSGRTYQDRDTTRVYRNYERYVDRDTRSSRPVTRPDSRYSDPIFSNRDDADEVLVAMLSILEDYDVVTVKELYGLLGKPADYTLGDYGWYNLDDAKILRTREGYLLKLPRPKVIS